MSIESAPRADAQDIQRARELAEATGLTVDDWIGWVKSPFGPDQPGAEIRGESQ